MYPRMFLDVSMKMSTSFSYFANAIVMRCCQRGEWCKVQSRAEIIKLRYLITYFLFTKFTYFTFTTFLPTPVVVIILWHFTTLPCADMCLKPSNYSCFENKENQLFQFAHILLRS